MTRVAVRALLIAAVLTVATAVAHYGLAPRMGFVRSFYPTAEFGSVPVQQARATDVSLDFLRFTPSLPRRSFGVQWKGFWYVPAPRTLDLHVRSDDEVQVLVDSHEVIRRNPRERQRMSQRPLTLAEGAHEIVIRYRQHGRGMGLGVFASVPGSAPAPLPIEFIFTEPVTPLAMAIASAVPWLAALSALAWMMAAGIAIRSRFAAGRAWWRLDLATPRVFVNRLRLVAGPALVGPVVLFLLGPITIHAANPDEFVVPFAEIVWPWATGAIALAWTLLLVLSAVACALSERLARMAASVLLAVGLLLWVQGTFLVPDYGPLYGEALDLSAHAGRVPYEMALWAGVLALAVIHARRVSAMATTLSLLFVGLQIAAAFVALAIPLQPREAAPAGWRSPPPEMYTLSRSKNVIHIVLDGYLSELFAEAVAEDRAYFDRTFSGFVFFADHLGAFPTTRASMPAMLTGEVYRNEEPFDTFLRRVLQQRSIASALSEHRFKVRSITFHQTDHMATDAARSPAVQYNIPTPFGSYSDYVRFMALQLFDFAAFRYVPQVLKASV